MWLWIGLAVVCTFLIAAVSVGVVSGSLARRPRRSVYDLEEAVEFVADRLPDELTARISYDEVREVLLAHCAYLAEKGIASERTAEAVASSLVVVSDHEPLAFVLGRVETAGLELSDADVVTILDTEVAYYEAIGAIGPQLDAPPEPTAVEPDDTRRNG